MSDDKTASRSARVLRYLSERDAITWAPDYAEPGYETPGLGIAFGNWNDGPYNAGEKAGRILERLGVAIEWSDEWATCDGCYKAVRTEPNSYHWVRSYVMSDDCTILCKTCAMDDPDDYVAGLMNNPDRADTFDVDLSTLGFVRHVGDGFESGLHVGQDDDPRAIAKIVERDRDYVFQIDGAGQFDVRFSLWTRPKRWEEDE